MAPWIDRLALHVAGRRTTRRGAVRLGTGAALAGMALAPGTTLAAVCQRSLAP